MTCAASLSRLSARQDSAAIVMACSWPRGTGGAASVVPVSVVGPILRLATAAHATANKAIPARGLAGQVGHRRAASWPHAVSLNALARVASPFSGASQRSRTGSHASDADGVFRSIATDRRQTQSCLTTTTWGGLLVLAMTRRRWPPAMLRRACCVCHRDIPGGISGGRTLAGRTSSSTTSS
jgi:hypothetical protein